MTLEQFLFRELPGLLPTPPASLNPRSLIKCPQCLSVSFSPAARWRAARALVRPREVAHLFTLVPDILVPRNYSVAGNIATWFGNSFARGTLRYRPDPPGRDIWCSPAMTLFTGGGDCDDLAILGASMIEYAGAAPQVAIGYYCDGRICQGHAWIEGHDGQGWFLLEGTSGALYRGLRPNNYVLRQLVRPRAVR